MGELTTRRAQVPGSRVVRGEVVEERIYRTGGDGHLEVAVLISPAYGGGWSTWAWANASNEDEWPDEQELKEAMLFDPDMVRAVLNDNIEEALRIAEEKFPHVYKGGLRDIEVVWIKKGTTFRVTEYDGFERIETIAESIIFKA